MNWKINLGIVTTANSFIQFWEVSTLLFENFRSIHLVSLSLPLFPRGNQQSQIKYNTYDLKDFNLVGNMESGVRHFTFMNPALVEHLTELE